MVLTCILFLIINLLKSWELSQYFKILKKKSFYFLLVFEITNLRVKCIPDIKKVFLLLT
jgi:hypothetical protein